MYFPASGYRQGSTGRCFGVGVEGDSWSSSLFGAGSSPGGYFSILVDAVNIFRGVGRPFALPVRCVQELIALLNPECCKYNLAAV